MGYSNDERVGRLNPTSFKLVVVSLIKTLHPKMLLMELHGSVLYGSSSRRVNTRPFKSTLRICVGAKKHSKCSPCHQDKVKYHGSQ